MAERAKPKRAASKPAPVPTDRLPTELLRRRSAIFLSMTQGAGKPMQYPTPTPRKP